MKKRFDLNDLLAAKLLALYDGEKRQIRIFPKLIDQVSNPDLKMALTQHLEETKDQRTRLKRVFELLYTDSRRVKSKAVRDMLREARNLCRLYRGKDNETLDAGLLGIVQSIKHLEIAGYGATATYANLIGDMKVAHLLHESLEEEKGADRKLTILAEENINLKAIDPDAGAKS